MKVQKSPIFAGVLNFLFWGIGYLYLEKKADEAFYLIASDILVWVFSFWYLSMAGLLTFPGIYWIIFWSLFIRIYIGYDAYKVARVKK